jgi:hypothetical protein
VRRACWVASLRGGQKGFDNFVSEDEQRSHCPETGRERLVAAGVADPVLPRGSRSGEPGRQRPAAE